VGGHEQGLEFVVGAEKRLKDVLSADDAVPLIECSVRAGAAGARICGDDGAPIWQAGVCKEGAAKVAAPVMLEGEAVGAVELYDAAGRDVGQAVLMDILAVSVNTLIKNSLKRMLTTETHTAVVRESYDELLKTNRMLAASEARYRELAESLEIKVRERTDELKMAHLKLLQQEKMASVGRLAAGMAHAINNPMGFVTSNLNTLVGYLDRYGRLLEFSRTAFSSAGGDKSEEFRRLWGELRMDFVTGDVPELLKQSLDGAARVKKIVKDLKGFSHVDDAGECQVDLNAEIDRALSVLEHERPAGSEVVCSYSDLPLYRCEPATLGQAFMNIILNAYQAVKDGLLFEITTAVSDSAIIIAFKDNGPGVPEEIRQRVFEPFFTTKNVGEGMGMGLALVYDIVTGLKGVVELDDAPGGGAVFTLRLPYGGDGHA